jgi:pimeloyl-ACP methyl ester carboxylesterase
MCLPGLSRTTADFDDLAAGLARGGRRVIAMDYRGRGRSEYDRDPQRYSFAVELADVIAVMTALSATPAIVVGTSRGGLLAMLLGATRPGLIAGVVLNDIGPAIDPHGLLRIKASLGNAPQPKDFDDAADILRRRHGAQFPKLTAAQWQAFARRTWGEDNGRLVLTYDPNLSVALATVDADNPVPALWKEFDALAHVPMMVIRGETSDILSRETVALMRARRSDVEFIEVPDQGHTPLLAEDDVIAWIAAFAARCDAQAAQ